MQVVTPLRQLNQLPILMCKERGDKMESTGTNYYNKNRQINSPLDKVAESCYFRMK